MPRPLPLQRLAATPALLPLLILTLPAIGAAAPGPASDPRTDDDPLAGRTWGVYQGSGDQAWEPYVRAEGRNKDLLARIALKPKAKWFGAWIPNADIAAKVGDYIANSQVGNPEALVPMTIFRMVPWEGDACRRLPTQVVPGLDRPRRLGHR